MTAMPPPLEYADFVADSPLPRRLGHIWVGDKMAPLDWMQTWRTHHPDWDYVLYDNACLTGRRWRNHDLICEYVRRRRYEGVSDLMRYEILYAEGGVIAEADAICRRPVDALFDKPTLYAVYENETRKPGNISPFIASVPRHPFLAEIIETIAARWTPQTLQDPWQSTGNRFLKFRIAARRIAMEVLPSHTFNPGFKGEAYTGDGLVYADQMWGTTRNLYAANDPDIAASVHHGLIDALERLRHTVHPVAALPYSPNPKPEPDAAPRQVKEVKMPPVSVRPPEPAVADEVSAAPAQHPAPSRDIGRFALRRPYRLHAQLLELVLGCVHARLAGKVFVLQIGANDGRMADPVYPWLRDHGWSGLLIEPHPGYFAELESRHRKNAQVAALNIAISADEGTLPLYHLSVAAQDKYPRWARGCASLDRSRMQAAIVTAAIPDARPEDLDCTHVALRRMDAVLRERDITQVDVIVIDVEGHELSVMASFDMGLLGVSVAIVECNGDNLSQESDYVAVLRAAGLQTFRLGDDLVGLRGDRLAVPTEDILRAFGLGTDQEAEA